MLRKLGWINLRLSQYDKAYQFLGEALELLNSRNSPELFEVYHDIAWMFYRQGYNENARNYAEGARQVLTNLPAGDATTAARIDLRHLTALIEAADGNHGVAAENLKAEIEDHLRSGDNYKLAGAYNKLASISMALGEIGAALKYQEQTHALAQQFDEVFRLMQSHKNYGDIYYVIGDFDRALHHYQESLALAQSIHNRLGEVFPTTGIGKVHGCRGDDTAAAGYLGQALAIARELGNKDREASIMVDLAQMHCRHGRFTEAANCLETAAQIEADRGQRISPRYQLNKARTLFLQNTSDGTGQALQLVEQLLSAPIRINDEEMISIPELRIAAHLLKAEIMQRGGRSDAARQEIGNAAAAIGEVCAPLPDGLRSLFRAKPAIADVYALQRQLGSA